MRAKDFLLFEQDLFEVNMSPSNLKKLAAATGAKVGIEFEMIVPNVNVDSERDPEPDYDADERIDDIDDICRFFYDGDYNSRRDIDSLRSDLTERFYDWMNEQITERWNGFEGKEFFAKWCRENISDEEVADQVGTPEDLLGDRIPSKEDWEKYIEEQWDDQDRAYHQAEEEFEEELRDSGDYTESDFLEEAGFRRMSDIEDEFQITWPVWTYNEGGEQDLSEIADDFSRAIGRDVDYSTEYHGGRRSNTDYTIEPDSSLSPDDSDDSGLEFISPPLPIDEMVEDIKKVKEWAEERGCYTNRSTGLHMNVSVPDFDREKLDFVKLVLLLGDKYITDQFERTGNYYCKNAMDIIKDASPQDTELLFKKLKNNMESIASKVIHTGDVGKFTSINPKNNRVEFRGPGGDWLDKNFDKIENTMYRCVVALDAACDPAKYRKDYLKALYKMYSPKKNSLEDLFVQYSAGVIDRTELKDRLKSIRRERITAKGIIPIRSFEVKPGDWIVEYENGNPDDYKFLALTKTDQVSDADEAMTSAMKLEPNKFPVTDIENIVVTEFTGWKDYSIQERGDQGGGVIIHAITPSHARATAIARYPELKGRDIVVKEVSDETDGGMKLYRLVGFDDATRTHWTQDIIAADKAAAMQVANDLYARKIDSSSDVALQDVDRDSWPTVAMMNSMLAQQNNLLANQNNQAQNPETANQYKLYKVSESERSNVFNYVAARSIGEAQRIAMLIYPQMGNDLNVVLQDAPRTMIGSYQARQQEMLDALNQPSRPRLAPGESLYRVVNNSTGEEVTLAATDSMQAYNRALRNNPTWVGYRQSIRSMLANTEYNENQSRPWDVTNTSSGQVVRVQATNREEALRSALQARTYWAPSDGLEAEPASGEIRV